MARASSLSGFPEFLPEERIIEQSVLDSVRTVFELHGFSGIETRSVEPLKDLLRKGETSKEVYVLSRLQAQEGEDDDGSRKLGLHFDLTVPLARYVLENRAYLDFPFRRYQIQKVWRGERPQAGRFREFTQADIDIIGDGTLAFHHEIEMPIVILDALEKLPIPRASIHVNSRKVLQGALQALDVENLDLALTAIDKIDKIGVEAVKELLKEAGCTPRAVDTLSSLAQISGADPLIVDQVRELGMVSDTLEEGLSDIQRLLEATHNRRPGKVIADFKIVRGLDYYTGMVYETFVEGYSALGSICSGGRYDSLASDGKRVYPGVGLSIGVSRLVSLIISEGIAQADRKVPTVVMVAVTSEETRNLSDLLADEFRTKGIAAVTSPNANKFGKQILHAVKRGIPYVLFPDSMEIKDLRTQDQYRIDPKTWMPPLHLLHPQVSRG
ncbi:MAG: histidine--tRNA ligase [Actinomycetaceae bacterium]|nr:histidine--tRNA ligase [Actinomycetaceae bacterium]